MMSSLFLCGVMLEIDILPKQANFVQSLETWPDSSCWVPGLQWGLSWQEAEDEKLPILSHDSLMLRVLGHFARRVFMIMVHLSLVCRARLVTRHHAACKA